MLILYIYIIVKTYIRRYFHTHSYTESRQTLIIHLFNNASLYNHTYVLLFHEKKLVKSFIKTSHGFITLSETMSRWQRTSSVKPGCWGETVKNPSEACHNWKPICPRALVRTLILLKCHATMLAEGFPTKILKIYKRDIVTSNPYGYYQ